MAGPLRGWRVLRAGVAGPLRFVYLPVYRRGHGATDAAPPLPSPGHLPRFAPQVVMAGGGSVAGDGGGSTMPLSPIPLHCSPAAASSSSSSRRLGATMLAGWWRYCCSFFGYDVNDVEGEGGWWWLYATFFLLTATQCLPITANQVLLNREMGLEDRPEAWIGAPYTRPPTSSSALNSSRRRCAPFVTL